MPIMPTDTTTSATSDSTSPNPCCDCLNVRCIGVTRFLGAVRAASRKSGHEVVDVRFFRQHLSAPDPGRPNDSRARQVASSEAQASIVTKKHGPGCDARVTWCDVWKREAGRPERDVPAAGRDMDARGGTGRGISREHELASVDGAVPVSRIRQNARAVGVEVVVLVYPDDVAARRRIVDRVWRAGWSCGQGVV